MEETGHPQQESPVRARQGENKIADQRESSFRFVFYFRFPFSQSIRFIKSLSRDMGRRYYCCHCQCWFNYTHESRRKHFSGAHHQRLVKQHYDLTPPSVSRSSSSTHDESGLLMKQDRLSVHINPSLLFNAIFTVCL